MKKRNTIQHDELIPTPRKVKVAMKPLDEYEQAITGHIHSIADNRADIRRLRAQNRLHRALIRQVKLTRKIDALSARAS